jgi:hypothetical protein
MIKKSLILPGWKGEENGKEEQGEKGWKEAGDKNEIYQACFNEAQKTAGYHKRGHKADRKFRMHEILHLI